jgi:hypothetical protein
MTGTTNSTLFNRAGLPRGIPLSAPSSTLGIEILVITISWLACLLSIPHDSTAPGALMVPSLLSIGGVCIVGAIRYFNSGPASLFSTPFIVLFGFVYLMLGDLISPVYSIPLDTLTVFKCFFASGLFILSFIIGSSVRTTWRPSRFTTLLKADYSVAGYTLLITTCCGLSLVHYAIYSDFSISNIVAGLIAARFGAPWNRGPLGGWNAFSDFLTNFGYVLPMLTVAAAISIRRWFHWLPALGAVFSLLFLPFIIQGNGRRDFGIILGAPILTLVVRRGNLIKARHLVVILMIVIIILIAMQLIITYRSFGLAKSDLSSFDLNEIHVDGNLLSLGHVFEAIPDQHPYVTWRWPYFALALPIPRVFWEGKPVDPGFDLGKYLNSGGTSYTMTAAGEWYMAFAWPGILIGGYLHGLLASKWSSLLRVRLSPLGCGIYGFGVMVQFASMRSVYELLHMSKPLICLAMLHWLLPRHLLISERLTQSLKRFSVRDTRSVDVAGYKSHRTLRQTNPLSGENL